MDVYMYYSYVRFHIIERKVTKVPNVCGNDLSTDRAGWIS